MSTEPNKNTHYELPTGAIAILEEILGTPTWYKDDPKQGVLIVRAVGALEALPETKPRPVAEKDESRESFQKKVDVWAADILQYDWSEKQKAAVRTCVAYYLKQGAFAVNTNTVALLSLLGLDDE